MDSSSEEFTTNTGIFAQLAGLFLGAVAFAGSMQANYMLVNFACETGWFLVLHGVSFVGLLVALTGVGISHRSWRRAGARWDEEGAGRVPRTRFAASLGSIFGLLAAAGIAAQWLTILLMHPCVH